MNPSGTGARWKRDGAQACVSNTPLSAEGTEHGARPALNTGGIHGWRFDSATLAPGRQTRKARGLPRKECALRCEIRLLCLPLWKVKRARARRRLLTGPALRCEVRLLRFPLELALAAPRERCPVDLADHARVVVSIFMVTRHDTRRRSLRRRSAKRPLGKRPAPVRVGAL